MQCKIDICIDLVFPTFFILNDALLIMSILNNQNLPALAEGVDGELVEGFILLV